MFFHKTHQRHLFKITIHKFPEEDIVKTIQISFTSRSSEICFTKCLFELLLYNPINCFHVLLHKALNNNFRGIQFLLPCCYSSIIFQRIATTITTYLYVLLRNALLQYGKANISFKVLHTNLSGSSLCQNRFKETLANV